MKFLHITDIHLDHLEATSRPAYVANMGHEAGRLPEFKDYYNKRIVEDEIDAILITGDISTRKYLEQHLLFLESNIKAPIYFVLGNHDYYGDKDVLDGNSRAVAKRIGNGVVLTYATEKPTVLSLDKKVAIVGTDGWYDGEYASFYKSDLFMTDFTLIGNFGNIFKRVVKTEIKKGDFYPRFSGTNNAAEFSYHVEKGLPGYLGREFKRTAKKFTEILENNVENILKTQTDVNDFVILTHVAPFMENSIYKDKMSDGDWMPYFSNKSLGDYLISLAQKNQDKNFVVLCGHSHGQATNQVLPNLVCHTTSAEYREIYAGRIIEI